MLWKVFTHQLFFGCIKNYLKAENIIKMPFYAVARGRTTGIYMNWSDCENQVKGFPGARYKKFNTTEQAQDFINIEGGSGSTFNKPSSSLSSYGNNANFNSSSRSTSSSNFQKNNPSISFSSSSNYSNVKRPFSTTSSSQNDRSHIPNKRARRIKSESSNSDESGDDLNTILTKQLDDVEKRLKGFEKGVDKIIKKNTKPQRKTVLIEPQALNRNVCNSGSRDFNMDSDGYVQVYTDGACSANGKTGAKAGLGVYWGDGHELNVSEPVSGRATNNCGEIQAATRAIKLAINQGVKKLAINTDSKFVIDSVTKWMPGWKKKGWKLRSGEPVKNEIDFKDLDSVQNKIQIKWNYVEAHRGIHGNEMADQLAKAGASNYKK